MHLDAVAIGTPVVVQHVGGDRAFRRRMMELGLLPNTAVEVVRVAPLGDPMELRVRGCHLSIRKQEARAIAVAPVAGRAPAPRRPDSAGAPDEAVRPLEVVRDAP